MGLTDLPRTAVRTYIKAVRLPVDAGLKALGRGRGSAPAVAVDRVDSTAREVAGSALGDPALKAEGRTKRVAADERERATELRTAAAERESQATERAERRRAQAKKAREATKQEAATTAAKRKSAARATAAKQRKAATERAQDAKLESAEAKAKALDERERALAKASEAARLDDAAGTVKAVRKAG